MPELHFTVDSALLSELGEKLVETVHIALLELVKNAYDADATCAIVAMITIYMHSNNRHVTVHTLATRHGRGPGWLAERRHPLAISGGTEVCRRAPAKRLGQISGRRPAI